MKTRAGKLRAAILIAALLLPAGGGLAGAADDRSVAPRPGLDLMERLSNPLARLRSDGKTGRFAPARERLLDVLAEKPETAAEARDPRRYAAVTRRALAALGIEHLAAGAAATGDLSTSAATTVIRVAIGAGDLNGNGRDDLLELETTLDTGTFEIISGTMRARGGAKGRNLWERPIVADELFLIPAGDLTGDRKHDLLTLELFVGKLGGQGGCVEITCAGTFSTSFRWVLQILSGANGRPIWSKAYDGSYVEAGGGAFGGLAPLYAGAAGGAVVVRNAVVLPMLSGDHDGDGTPDVIVDAIDILEVFGFGDVFSETGAGGFVFAGQVATATRAEVARGRNGRTLYERAAAPQLGVSYLWSPGDAVGSATADLFWEDATWVGPLFACTYAADEFNCNGLYVPRITAEMIDGATFATAWRAERPVGTDGFFFSLGGDLDGDGADDLTFLAFGEEGIASHMVSGRTGATLWSTQQIVLGAIGGTPGGPPLVLTVDDSELFESSTFSLRRLDGRTGEEVFSTSYAVEVPGEWWELFIFIELWILPDADADGVDDPFVQITVYAGSAVRVETVLESGAGGARLFERTADRELFSIPLADMDGDGVTDLLDVDITPHRRSFDIDLSGRTMPDGAVLWTRPLRLFPSFFAFVETTGDLSGAGGQDTVLNIIQDTPTRVESAVQVVEQRTGSTLWQLGKLSTPPLPGTSAIAGTITGDGNPFFGACVSTYDLDYGYLGTEIAAGDGTYLFAELDPGSYKVEFGSCFFEPYRWEFYDDEPDFDSADVVVVRNDATVMGIDADLAPDDVFIED